MRHGGVVVWRSGNGVGHINEVTMHLASVSTGMGDRQYFTKPPKPTQPPTLSGA